MSSTTSSIERSGGPIARRLTIAHAFGGLIALFAMYHLATLLWSVFAAHFYRGPAFREWWLVTPAAMAALFSFYRYSSRKSIDFLGGALTIVIVTALLLPFSLWNSLLLAYTVSVAGTAILADKVRGIALLACAVAEALIVVEWKSFGDPDPTVLQAVEMSVLAAGAVWLLWPRRSSRVAGPVPDAPDESNWQLWLMHWLGRDGVKVQDRFALAAVSWIVIAVLTVVICGLIGVFTPAILFPFVFLLVFFKGPAFRETLPLTRLHKRLASRNAIEELANDGARRPVFYLRAFHMDGSPAEDRAMAEFRKIGPVIAIGRPNELLPSLGAARFYVGHDRWQETVAAILRVSQLVVWTTGTTDGLRWELSHILENLPPEKLVLWAHPRLQEFSDWMLGEQEWARFRTAFGPMFPRPLPERLGSTAFICFDEDFSPIPVEPDFSVEGDSQASAARGVLRLKGYSPAASTVDQRSHNLLLKFSAALSAALLALIFLGDMARFLSRLWN
jgi:hypothetical protein